MNNQVIRIVILHRTLCTFMTSTKTKIEFNAHPLRCKIDPKELPEAVWDTAKIILISKHLIQLKIK